LISLLRVQAPLYRRGPSYSLVSGCPDAGSSVAAVLTWARHPLALCRGAGCFIKRLFPLDQHIRAYASCLPRILLWRRGLPVVVGGGRAWLASCWSPASVDLVEAMPLLIKCPLEGFCHLRRLGPPMMKMLAGCWHSRPPRPDVVVISRMSAGRWLCPWPTQIVIPTTLAPETGEVSWVSMRLRWVLFLAEVDSHPLKYQDLSSS
jgi:hypothetical protein